MKLTTVYIRSFTYILSVYIGGVVLHAPTHLCPTLNKPNKIMAYYFCNEAKGQ